MTVEPTLAESLRLSALHMNIVERYCRDPGPAYIRQAHDLMMAAAQELDKVEDPLDVSI